MSAKGSVTVHEQFCPQRGQEADMVRAFGIFCCCEQLRMEHRVTAEEIAQAIEERHRQCKPFPSVSGDYYLCAHVQDAALARQAGGIGG